MIEKKQQGDILYNFFYTIFKRKFLALAVAFMTFVGIMFGTYLVTPMWKATAKIRVQYTAKQQLTMLEGITTPGSVVPGVNPANDVATILQSRELAEEVVKIYERDKLWERKATTPNTVREKLRAQINPLNLLRKTGIFRERPTNYLAKAVKEMQDNLEEVELEQDTTIVNVSVWGETPETATAMSNTLVELLMQKNLIASRTPIDETIGSTELQLQEAEANLHVAQEDLRRFKEESGLVLYREEATILLQRLDEYERKLNDMESNLISLKIGRRADQFEVESLEKQIEEFRHKLIPDLESKLASLSLKEVEFANLEKELEVREALYTTLKEKLLELEVLKNSSMGDLEIKVIDPARVYSNVRPDWPRLVLTIPFGLIWSVLIGLAFIFFIEYWNNSYKSVKKLEEDLEIRVLGAVPRISYGDRRKIFTAPVHGADRSTGSNLPAVITGQRRFRSLKVPDRIVDEILLSSNERLGNRYVITSPGQYEGKTTVAAMVCQILAVRGKRTLLIEGNLRTPNLEKIYRAHMTSTRNNKLVVSHGLADTYYSDIDLKDVIKSVNGVDVIFAGNLLNNQVDIVEIISSDKFRKQFQQLSKEYDFILVDSPCIKRYTDAFTLNTLTDGVIVIVEADRTPKRTLLMAIHKIENAAGKIKGLVLNKQVNYVPELIQNFINSI